MNQVEQNSNVSITDSEINLIELFKIFWGYKLMIIVLVGIFCAGSVIYALSLPNIYTAEVTLAPVGTDGSSMLGGIGALGGLASLAGISTSGEGDVVANIAVMKSRIFIMKFIRENQLLPIIFSEIWDENSKRWLVENEKSVPGLQKAYLKFSKDILRVEVDNKTGLIALKVSWVDSQKAADWANKIVKEANLFLKQKAVDEAQQSVLYLKNQIHSTREVGIQELLYKLVEKELQTIKLASVKNDYAFKVLDPAIPPENKSKPRRSLICIFGAVIGVLFSFIMVLVINFIREK